MPIKVLDPSVVGRIAAGEVVERPSSVAKELIENSIDAGATAITLEIRDGGISYLRVTDNGCGIAPGQVGIAFENHATSKITDADQLNDIRTLGFRGEALPSIAAVSHVELTTREKGAPSGVKLAIDGGIKQPVKDVGCPEGTTIVIKELFYNVPVRRTFLKRASYEASLVNELAARMIIGNPNVSFRFINNGKSVYHSFGDGNLKHAIFAVYGSDVAEKMIPIDGSCGSMRISGMIGIGDLSKATRSHQLVYINGRMVRCQLITQVLEQICKGRVTIGTYPMCALTLTMSASIVDVNVHPNKLEVRFRDEQSVRLVVENILAKAFVGENVLDLNKEVPAELVHEVHIDKTDSVKKSDAVIKEKPTTPVSVKQTVVGANETEVGKTHTEVGIEAINKDIKQTDVDNDAINTSPLTPAQILGVRKDEHTYMLREDSVGVPPPARRPLKDSTEKSSEQLTIDSNETTPDKPAAKPQYRVIGTLFDTYILLELNESMIMIDQHAAHERLLYDKFTERLKAGVSASQALLVPLVIDVSAREMAVIEENLDALSSAGYTIEPFGDRSVSVRAVPFIMGHADIRPLFMDMIGSLERIGKSELENRADEIAKMACKAAVKAGDKLTDSEISALITLMLETNAPPTCPHGRPVSMRMTRRDIEKLFKRIQ